MLWFICSELNANYKYFIKGECMKNSDKLTLFHLFIGNIVLVAIGILLIVIWTPAGILVTVTNLFSFQGAVSSLIIGLIGAFAAGIYIYIIMKIGKGYLPDTRGSNEIVELTNDKKISLIGLILLPSVVEEFLFRGVIQTYMVDIFNPFWGVVISAFIFMLAHISDQYKGQPYLLFHIFWLGVVSGIAFIMTESLWASIMIHLLNNYWSVKNIRNKRIKIKVTN